MRAAKNMEFFDSHEQVKSLMHAGVKTTQAEAIVKVLSFSRRSDIANLATKDQVTQVKTELEYKIDQVKTELEHKIDQVKTELEYKIDQVKTELEHKIDQLDAKIDRVKVELEHKIDAMGEKTLVMIQDAKFDTIKWMIGLFITMMLAIYFK